MVYGKSFIPVESPQVSIPVENANIFSPFTLQFQKQDLDRSMLPNLRVVECFQQGLTGKGVRVVVLDDGLDFKHEDLSPNYVSSNA